jgi:hypothetical protein
MLVDAQRLLMSLLLLGCLSGAVNARANFEEDLWSTAGITADKQDENLDNNKPLQQQLVGLIVDGIELTSITLYRDGQVYLLPVAPTFEHLGIEPEVVDGDLLLATPGGDVMVPRAYFHRIHGVTHFDASLLHKELMARWHFSQTDFAIEVTLPWWRQPNSTAAKNVAPVDYKPASFGINQLRFDHTRFEDETFGYYANEILTRGRMAEGVWQAEIFDVENQDTLAQDYFWLRDFDSTQVLAGHQRVSMHPLLPVVETTGVQGLYDSMPREFDPYHDQTRSQFIRRSGLPIQDVEGTAQPGAIAELRIDSRPARRVRVRLDGSYEFPDVAMPQLQFVPIEVAILDQRSLLVLEIQDFTRTPSDLLLDAGQTVVFGGAGVHGNPLNSNISSEGETLFSLARYGVSDRVTLEGGLQTVDGVAHAMLGATAAMGRRWAGSVGIADRKGNGAFTAEFFGRDNAWQLNARSQIFGSDYRLEGAHRSSAHDVTFEYQVSPTLRFGAYARVVDSASQDEAFILPGAFWQFGQRSFARLWPSARGGYRSHIRTYLRSQDWLEYVGDDDEHRAEYRYFYDERLEFFGRWETSDELGQSLEVGFNLYPRSFDDRSIMQASLLSVEGEFGYRLRWETPIVAGLYSNLELRDVPRGGLDRLAPNGGLQLLWRLTLDLSFAGGRVLPARNRQAHSRTGAVGGRLRLADGGGVKGLGIRQVAVVVDGVPRVAQVNGDYFYLDHLRPGIHTMSLDAEHLPLALTPQSGASRVEVAASATTRVDFSLSAEYGISGRVSGLMDAGVVDAKVTVVEVRNAQGEIVARGRCDAYGYYRVSGIVPGTYTLSTHGNSIKVDVVDDFILDGDIHLRPR